MYVEAEEVVSELIFCTLPMSIKTLLNVFEISLLCSARLHFIDTKYCKNSNIVKYYYNLK